MKRIFTSGEKVWLISPVLFLIWAIIGNLMVVPVRTISVMGSIGMFLFVAITLLSIVVLREK